MAAKTYVLLDSMDSNAPIYQTTAEGQRLQLKKIPIHRPTLRQTFQDEDGVGKTIRYKSASKTIDQSEQIKEEKIEANERFTDTERNDLLFRHGVLTTNKLMAQTYLEAHPEFEGFKGTCDEVKQPRYRLLDEAKSTMDKNSFMRRLVEAGQKIFSLELEEAQEMLIRLNGSFFVTPTDVKDCQNLLMEFLDDTNDAGIDAILKDGTEATVDEKATVLIGKLLNADILSFDKIEGQVSKKGKGGKWIPLKEISVEYPLEERKRFFSDFLNTVDGELLKKDLEVDLLKLK